MKKIMSFQIKHRNAFTLIESVVVIGIVASMLLLTMIVSQGVSRRSPRVEQTFWHTFNSNWQEAEYASKYRVRHTFIDFYARKVVFRTFKGEGEKFQVIKYPKTITFLGLAKKGENKRQDVPQKPNSKDPLLIVHIYADSHADPQTLLFRSQLKNGNRKLTVQMGWGLYRLEKY